MTLYQFDESFKKQTGSRIKTYLYAHGGDVGGLFDVAKSAKLNLKQRQLIASLEADPALKAIVMRNIDKLELE